MMGWGGYGGFGMGLVGWLFMLVFWGLIIVGLVLVVRWLWDHGRSAASAGAGTGTAETPLEILKRRYARGEISKMEYDRMKQDLAYPTGAEVSSAAGTSRTHGGSHQSGEA
jgi:putative membrane protein